MALVPGSRLGPYEVLAPLGAGGMGEVYRARDGRLGRDVALKVLPDRLAGDGDARDRFEREARLVAALSHPAILAIHDFGRDEATGTAYAVMELLEGETLRARLAGGALPPRKTVELGREIAQGLAAAHEKGVVHRDLKPENLFVTRGGHVKILDFGLARQLPEAATTDTQSPTAAPATGPGTVLGTVGYMSPEQVRGRPADARSDLFSLGVVLYEMLSGRRPFQRDTAAETMAAILRDDPPALALGGGGLPPAGLERIVRHCLEKEPDERFRSAHDLAFALDAVPGSSAPTSAIGPVEETGRVARRLGGAAVAAAALAGLLAGAVGSRLAFRATPGVIALRPLGSSGTDGEPAVSPDGRTLAFSSDRSGQVHVWLKQLPSGAEVALTSGPDSVPRFSPDGTQLVFVRSRSGLDGGQDLYRVPVLGGEPRRLLSFATGADWSPDGKVVVATATLEGAPGPVSRLVAVPSDGGGTPREVIRFPGRALVGPRFSPDGRTVAVASLAVGGNQGGRYELVDLERGTSRPLEPPRTLGALSNLLWLKGGREVLYAEGVLLRNSSSSSMLYRQAVDAPGTTARPLLWLPEEVAVLEWMPGGSLVADTTVRRQNLSEIRLDREERGAARWLTRGTDANRQPVFSPDGDWLAFSSNQGGNLDIWARSVKTGAIRRLTEDPVDDWDPGFMPDGRLLFSSARSGHLEIWIADADGNSPRRVTDDGVDAENPTGTADGWIVYYSSNPKKEGVWKIKADGSSPTQLYRGGANMPDVSPDGRYVAFANARATRQVTALVVGRVADGSVVPVPIPVPRTRGTEALPSAARAGCPTAARSRSSGRTRTA